MAIGSGNGGEGKVTQCFNMFSELITLDSQKSFLKAVLNNI